MVKPPFMALRDIPKKVNRILHFFLATLALIFAKAWLATHVNYETHLQESLKPMRRTVIQRANRATIRDRFNIPLAINQTQYNAAIVYADIRTIPRIVWEKDAQGKRHKRMKRRAYLERLATFLAEQLDMDPYDIKDMMCGRACLFPHTPFVLKEDIGEKLYLKLKGAEKDWVGIEMQQTSKRVYPEGKLACDVVGYVGAISERECRETAQELSTLKSYLERYRAQEPAVLPKGLNSLEEIEERVGELMTRSLAINDVVGKAGIEAAFDSHLRGGVGRSIYAVDVRGNRLAKLPASTSPQQGKRLILTLSAELQREAEQLLTEYESLQDQRDAATARKRSHPWQRGGAVVAVDPHTGEVLALASYPRFDPNDLVPAQTVEKRLEKRDAIIQWLESLPYVGQIWDGKRPLERERWSHGRYTTEASPLTWEVYLDTILDKGSTAHAFLKKIETLGQAIGATCDLDQQRDLDLVRDILEMVAPKRDFPASLLREIGSLSIAEHRLFCQIKARHIEAIKQRVRTLFHRQDFRAWRQEHFKEFLKRKRTIERRNNRWARPYIEYLEREERRQFATFWSERRDAFFKAYLLKEPEAPYFEEMLQLRNEREDGKIEELEAFAVSLSPPIRDAFLKTLRTFDDLDRPLSRSYPRLRSEGGIQRERHLAAGFYPKGGFGYGRAYAFRQAAPQGSLFKLLTAYSGLMYQYEKKAKDLNPLVLIDDIQQTAPPGNNRQILGRFPDGQVIRRLYKGGRLPRAPYPRIGKIGITEAIERTSNLYFSVLAGDILDTPNRLTRAALDFGLGNPTGIDLPGEYGGVLPSDLHHNKTGLYAFAIGQHSLVVTPLQTAMMLAAIANGGKLLKPQILTCRASDTCQLPVVRDQLDLPSQVQAILLQGMRRVTSSARGTARPSLIRPPFHNRSAFGAYQELHTAMAGKTGTAEILFKQTLDAESSAALEKHTWFGAIGYDRGRADIVVVVFNRFGTAGKQGAPLAAQLIKKWRTIQHATVSKRDF